MGKIEWTEPPRRIRRQRAKGWRMPENAVYVGRPTKWGNPFVAGKPHPYDHEGLFGPMSLDDCLSIYRELIPLLFNCDPAELRGKDLACWCRLDQRCHADILLELANA
jgi:hypothetical protein